MSSTASTLPGRLFEMSGDSLATPYREEVPAYPQLLPGTQLLLQQYGIDTLLKVIAVTGKIGPVSTLPARISRLRQGDLSASRWYTPSYGSGHRTATEIFNQDMINKFLQCERCGACYDTRFVHIYPAPSSVQIANDSISMSYVYCPRNSGNICEISSTESWKTTCSDIELTENNVAKRCSEVFLQLIPQIITRQILGTVAVTAEHQVETLYQSLRVAWHSLVFGSENLSDRNEEGTLPEHIVQGVALLAPLAKKKLVMWGDARTDLELYKAHLLSGRALEYAYQLPPRVIQFMVDSNDWAIEIKWVNEYVALRRYMSKAQFALAKRAIQRATASMEKTLFLQQTLQQQTHEVPYQRAVAASRLRFRELHSSMRADLDLHTVDRRTTEKVPQRNTSTTHCLATLLQQRRFNPHVASQWHRVQQTATGFNLVANWDANTSTASTQVRGGV